MGLALANEQGACRLSLSLQPRPRHSQRPAHLLYCTWTPRKQALAVWYLHPKTRIGSCTERDPPHPNVRMAVTFLPASGSGVCRQAIHLPSRPSFVWVGTVRTFTQTVSQQAGGCVQTLARTLCLVGVRPMGSCWTHRGSSFVLIISFNHHEKTNFSAANFIKHLWSLERGSSWFSPYVYLPPSLGLTLHTPRPEGCFRSPGDKPGRKLSLNLEEPREAELRWVKISDAEKRREGFTKGTEPELDLVKESSKAEGREHPDRRQEPAGGGRRGQRGWSNALTEESSERATGKSASRQSRPSSVLEAERGPPGAAPRPPPARATSQRCCGDAAPLPSKGSAWSLLVFLPWVCVAFALCCSCLPAAQSSVALDRARFSELLPCFRLFSFPNKLLPESKASPLGEPGVLF